MPKYSCGPGDPIDMLVEECAEVIMAVQKGRRFGFDGTKEWLDQDPSRKTPRNRLIQEIGDIIAVLKVIVDFGILGITTEEIDTAIECKQARLNELFG